MSRFKIIKDTREKKGHGWWFEEDAYCIGTEVSKVDVGDYAIEGMEHLLCIERKESVSEFAGNCGEKRFHRELEKMATFILIMDVIVYQTSQESFMITTSDSH